MVLVEHHIKYKEIHGVDETVMMDKGEHKHLHSKLRKEGKCNIPVEELRIISNIANRRTIKVKEYQKIKRKEYQINNKEKINNRIKRNCQKILFNETIDKNIYLHEELRYYKTTNNISYNTCFLGNHGRKLIYIEV
jgi:phosphoribosylformylglycinamidine (FGAM) synthase PurS component